MPILASITVEFHAWEGDIKGYDNLNFLPLNPLLTQLNTESRGLLTKDKLIDR